MKKFNFDIVLLADRTYGSDKLFDIDGNKLEQISDEYFKTLYQALSDIANNVVHYNSPKDFINKISQHQNDLVFTVYGGYLSRNRMALIPAICEAYNIKYVGADSYARIICQDKQVSKEIANEFNIKSAKYIVIRNVNNMDFAKILTFPVVVKPLYEGSSIGIDNNSLCSDYEKVKLKVSELIKKFKQPVLVEEFISGKELVVCFVGNQKKIILNEFVEIFSTNNENYFLSNLLTAENKHKGNMPFIHKRISNDILNREMPKLMDLYLSLGKMDFMRIDGRLTNDGFYLIELTPDAYIGDDCSFADIYSEIGKPYTELLYDIISIALDHYQTPSHSCN